MGTSPFFTQNIFLTYFPHFVPRGTSNNLQMLNTQNLPTLLYSVHKISVKYTITHYNIAQYCRQYRSSQSPKTWSSPRNSEFTMELQICAILSHTQFTHVCTFCSPSTSLFRAHILSSQKLEGFKNMHV